MDYNTTYTGLPSSADGLTMDMFNHDHNHHHQGYPPHVPLQHRDFIPECIDPGSVLTDKKFERFDILMQRANEWLRNRPYLKVVTCESIEVKKRSGDHGEVDTEKVTYYEYGEYRNKFIRALRLWCCSRHEHDPKGPSQISHFNIIPACKDPGGVFSNPKYESFNITLDKVNEELRRRPLPGHILNLETQDMKFHTSCDSVDPDETYWTEAGKTGTYFLNIIRIFYEVSAPAMEEIGCADFVPEILQQGGIITTAKFEPFASVVAQARCWIAQQHNIKIVSIQSIDYKLKSSWSGDGLDTHRTMFYERGEGFTYYLRILRVTYTRSHSLESEPLLLNYKTFIPVQLTRDAAFTTPKFETISETVTRANAWLSITGVSVVSSETVPIRLYSGNQHGDSEQTYTWNHGDRNETWLHVIRVYLNGDYEEPPQEALPPVPPLDEDECDCCAIS